MKPAVSGLSPFEPSSSPQKSMLTARMPGGSLRDSAWGPSAPLIRRMFLTRNQHTWRADRQPKLSITARPDGRLMAPNYRYKFLKEPATVTVSHLSDLHPVRACLSLCQFHGCNAADRFSTDCWLSFQVNTRFSVTVPIADAFLLSGGQGRAGVDLAPNRLISAGLVSQLAKLGWEAHYETQQSFIDIPYNPISALSSLSAKITGDTPVDGEIDSGAPANSLVPKMGQRLPDPDIGRIKKPRLVSAVCERLAQEVGRIAGMECLPLTLGGDHSLVGFRHQLYLNRYHGTTSLYTV